MKEKKLCFYGRGDRAMRTMYPRIPIDRKEPSFQIGSTHMGTGSSDLQVYARGLVQRDFYLIQLLLRKHIWYMQNEAVRT